jgi:hypothetical protein
MMTIVLGGMVTYHCPDLVEECINMHVLQQRLSHGLLDDENIPPLSTTIPGNFQVNGVSCFLRFIDWLYYISSSPGVAFCTILLTCLTPKMVTRPSMFFRRTSMMEPSPSHIHRGYPPCTSRIQQRHLWIFM